jgi:flagellar hook-associated protein 2
MTISALNRASNQPIGLERQKELIAKDQKNTAEKINTLDEKIRLLDENDKNIKSVYESLKALKDPQTLHARTLTLGDPDNKTLQATAAPNAQLGKQTITVSQIAAPTRIAGSIRQASTISTETISKNSFETGPFLSNINLNSLKTGTLSLSVQSPETHTAPIYGTFEIEFSDTLQDVFTKINHATQGDIEATYDPETDKISLTSQSGKDITIGSPEDTSNFWTLTRLFSTHHNANNGPRPSNLTTTSELPLSALNLNETIISTELKNHALLKTGPQTLTINGQSIDYNIQKDSLNAIMKRIQSSTANAELTYDRTTDSFTLTNRETGDINLHFSDPGGLLKAIGLATDESTYIPGKNAQFTINKGPLLSAHK